MRGDKDYSDISINTIIPFPDVHPVFSGLWVDPYYNCSLRILDRQGIYLSYYDILVNNLYVARFVTH